MSSTSSRPEPSREQRLQEVLAAYLQAVEAGKAPDRSDLLAQHPELASELTDFFANKERFEAAALPLRPGLETIGLGDARQSTSPRIQYFGDYELLEEIARGGMGVVYKAKQVSLNRPVALKMILAGQFATAVEVQRFYTEAEAAANLDHPNIVPIYEVGEHAGQHYFSMKLIVPGTKFCPDRDESIDQRQAVPFLITVARAVHYAHQRGIIHRDLKPANILMDAQGQPHVTDFGLAKRLDGDSNLSQSGAIVGTPAYMAPEQAASVKVLTTAADVYSLGAIFYELLTGKPPFVGATTTELLMQVLNKDPIPPRRARPNIDRDLETICLKCLAKDPEKRFGSAAALSEDLQRWLDGKPILARPTTGSERLVKWLKRHPALAGLAGLSVLALTALIWAILNSLYSQRLENALQRAETAQALAKSQRDRAQAQESRAVEQEQIARNYWYAADINWARRSWDRGNLEIMQGILDRQKPRPGQPDLRAFEWFHLNCLAQTHQATLNNPECVVNDVAFSADGNFLAVALGDAWNARPGSIKLWDRRTGRVVKVLQGHSMPVLAVRFSPDGKTLASAAWNGAADDTGEVIFWNAHSWEQIGAIANTQAGWLAYSPDSRWLATGGKRVAVWDADTRKVLETFPEAYGPVAFAPQGKRLVYVKKTDLHLWDGEERKDKSVFRGLKASPRAMQFTPDGKFLAAAGSNAVQVWNVASQKPHTWVRGSGELISRLPGPPGAINSLAFSPNGKYLLVGTEGKQVLAWDFDQARIKATLKGHTNWIKAVAFAPDGQVLASGSQDNTVRIWKLISPGEFTLLPSQSWAIIGVAFSPAGNTLVSADYTSLVFFDRATGKKTRSLPADHWVHHLAVASDGSTLATGGLTGGGAQPAQVLIRDLASGTVQHKLAPDVEEVNALTYSSDGKALAVGGQKVQDKNKTGLFQLWNVATGELIAQRSASGQRVAALAYSRHGRVLASAGENGVIQLWHPQTLRELNSLAGHTDKVRCLTFSPDDKLLASGSVDGTIRLWDADTGKETMVLRANSPVNYLAFAPDGKTLASENGVVTLWQVSTGQELLVLDHTYPVSSFAFSPDGKILAVASGWRDENEGLKLWHTIQE